MTQNEKPNLRKVKEALETVVYSGSLDGVIPVDMSAMLKEALAELQAYMDGEYTSRVISMDRAYITGLRSGYNLGVIEDNLGVIEDNPKLNKLAENRLKEIREANAAIKAVKGE